MAENPVQHPVSKEERRFLALQSTFSALVTELCRNGSINLNSYLEQLQGTAEAHRQSGDQVKIAEPLDNIAKYLEQTVTDHFAKKTIN